MTEKFEAKEGLSDSARLKGKKKWVVENLLTSSTPEFINGALEEVDAKGGMERSGS